MRKVRVVFLFSLSFFPSFGQLLTARVGCTTSFWDGEYYSAAGVVKADYDCGPSFHIRSRNVKLQGDSGRVSISLSSNDLYALGCFSFCFVDTTRAKAQVEVSPDLRSPGVSGPGAIEITFRLDCGPGALSPYHSLYCALRTNNSLGTNLWSANPGANTITARWNASDLRSLPSIRWTLDGAIGMRLTGTSYSIPGNFAGAARVSLSVVSAEVVGPDGTRLDIPLSAGSVTLPNSFFPGPVEVVDPRRKLMTGSSVTSAPAALATGGAPVLGVATDGVTQVVVKVTTKTPGTVTAAVLSDQCAGAVPSSCPVAPSAAEWGGLLETNGTYVNIKQALASDPDGPGPLGPMAFFIFQAPADFVVNQTHAGDYQRSSYLKITADDRPDRPVFREVILRRPPVLLIHGLWSNPGAWNNFDLAENKYYVRRIDYSADNGGRVLEIAEKVTPRISQILREFTQDTSVAAAQVDIVAHSMGGLVARALAARADYLRPQNFGKGWVHKLITIDTPHRGSELASFLSKAGPFCRGFFELSGRPVAGAIEDLAVGSSLDLLLDRPRKGLIAAHALTGLANTNQEEGTARSPIALFLQQPGICGPILGTLYSGTFRTLFNSPSDLIVSAASQAATGSAATARQIPTTPLPSRIHAADPYLFKYGPDVLDNDIQGLAVVQVPETGQRVATIVDGLLSQEAKYIGSRDDQFAPIKP